jgi:hypothetical protein
MASLMEPKINKYKYKKRVANNDCKTLHNHKVCE